MPPRSRPSWRIPSVDRQVAPELIDRFLTFLYLPGEETLLKGINKLAPGHYLIVQEWQGGSKAILGSPLRQACWLSEPQAAAKDELLELLAETVELHMIADVPVGVLLSGGVDSTAVLSFAVERTDKEISTYTVGFSDPGVTDERPYARLAAETFGTRHYDMTITAEDFAAFMPQYVWHMEEPVCEPPAIAMYYVSKLASKHVKVLLSGEGGDEAFAGYSNYRNLLWLERVKRCALSVQRRHCPGTLPGELDVSLASNREVRATDERQHFPVTISAAPPIRTATLETG